LEQFVYLVMLPLEAVYNASCKSFYS